MGEIVQIYVGQTGVQTANPCWELYCLEHDINADGTFCDYPSDNSFKKYFLSKGSNRVVPRAVLVDSEPNVIDQIPSSSYGSLYRPGCLVAGKEDSASIFSRGYFSIGTELMDITTEAIRKVTESCCNLGGFLMYRSIGGGTGSGLGTRIAEQLMDDYNKISKIEFVVSPSLSLSPLTVEPYNAVLATHLSMDMMNCSFILDNEALHEICAENLKIPSPTYENLNRIIGQVATTFTTSQRFGGHSDVSFAQFQHTLVPYPRIHFPIVSYAPLIRNNRTGCSNTTVGDITSSCFKPRNQLIQCNPSEGKCMSCVLLYRGNVTACDIDANICKLENKGIVRFVDWQPKGFKIGMNMKPPFTVPSGDLGNTDKTLLTLSNSTIIQRVWCGLISKFNRLYNRRTFIHHYIGEGMEEDSFTEALENICTLISDYNEVEDEVQV